MNNSINIDLDTIGHGSPTLQLYIPLRYSYFGTIWLLIANWVYSTLHHLHCTFIGQITIPSQNSDLTIWVKGERTIAISEYIGTVALGSTVEIGTLSVGDANRDNSVDMNDFFIFASNFGKSLQNEGFNRLADFNNDGEINMTDFFLFASNFGKTGAPRPEGASMMLLSSGEMSTGKTYESDPGGCNALLLRTVIFLILAMFILPLFRKR